MDEKPYKYENLPIPTYEEATSSRPTSSRSRTGPEEISDDAERQGLLGGGGSDDPATRRGRYEPPTVESERPSLDSLDGLEVESDEGEVRREMQQMDVEDPDSDNGSHRSLLTYRFKRFANFTSSFSSLHLPSFRRFLPSVRLPSIDWQSVSANRIVIIGRLVGIMLIMGVVYALVATNLLSLGRNRMGAGQSYDPESVRAFVQNGFRDPAHIGRHLRHITKYPHVAGTEGSYVLGEWIAETFRESELEDVNMERFDVYLNYPRTDGRRVAIIDPEDKRWEARLEEDNEETLVFHGHSKSGDVTGHLVYANFGSRDDFQKLRDLGVSVEGAVVLVRYYGSQGDRALKVKAAEEAGAVGCIIYSDPAQDGAVLGSVAPNGRFMPADGVQRGAVSLMSWVVGDVLSPGWASTPANKQRLKPEDSAGLVKIPSLPLSWRDASHLLSSLQGHGSKMEDDWAGEPSTEYWTGDQDSPRVNLKNLQDEEIYQPIYNVLGRIKGWEQPEKRIIVGNHRDAWCMGAADPGSGTAIMLHIVQIFGDLRRLGWRPLRTIEFASWDGEEYNLIGSTEHVENREEELRRDGVAYLNVDVGVVGQDFSASASPMFKESLLHAMGRVADPSESRSIRQIWEDKQQQLSSLGAGSDYVAFQDIVGTSSLDMSFEGQKFPYHSCYDNFDFMERFGDNYDSNTWAYSAAIGQIWALLILDFADNPLIPLDVANYADTLPQYADDLERDVEKLLNSGTFDNDVLGTGDDTLDFTSLRDAIGHIQYKAGLLNEFDNQWIESVYASGGGFETNPMVFRRLDRNKWISNFESNLLDLEEGGGLVNRTQFKHVLFAPQTWSGYDGETFPSIRQWMYIGDWTKVQEEVSKVAAILWEAGENLFP